MCGGKSGAKAVSSETATLLANLKPQILTAANATEFELFEPVSERTQVVAGVNHFVKVKVGADKYIHVTVWAKLDRTHEVTSVQTNKTESDEL